MKRPKYTKNDLVAEMAQITQRLGVSPERIFPKESPSKIRQLFHLYLENVATTDLNAVQKLYGVSKLPHPAFGKLKHDLKKILRMALLSANVRGQFDDKLAVRYDNYLECLKEWSLYSVLRNANRLAAATEVGERLLPKLLKYEFLDLTVRLTTYLARFHAIQTNDAKKTGYYLKIHDEALDRFYWESKSSSTVSELALPLTRSWGSKPHLLEKTAQKVREMLPQLDRIETPNTQANVRLINLIHHMNAQKWEEAAQICRDTILYFRSRPESEEKPLLTTFYSNLIINLTHLGQYEEAQKASEEQSSLVRLGSIGWLATKDAHATLCFRSADYESAQRSVIEVRNSTIWKDLQPNQREIWHIFEAWLAILHHSGHLESLDFDFRKSRFLNQVPEFSKDKRGMNVNLILVQILLLLQEGRWEALQERFEALGKYNYRMVRKAGQYRSYHFIRMALSIPKANFQRTKVMKIAARYIPLINRTPASFVAEKQDLEIIEFEKIWEIMREIMPKKAAQLRKAA